MYVYMYVTYTIARRALEPHPSPSVVYTHNLMQESVRPELGGRVSRLSEDTVEDPVGHGAGGETNYSLEWPAKWRQLSRRGSCKGNEPKTHTLTREVM